MRMKSIRHGVIALIAGYAVASATLACAHDGQAKSMAMSSMTMHSMMDHARDAHEHGHVGHRGEHGHAHA